MKKKIIAIVAVFAVIALMFVAYGCGKSNLEPETPVTSAIAAESQQNFNFVAVYNDNEITVLRETTTDSLFVKYKSHGYNALAGGLTQMMDPETGKPLTYTQWVNNYN